ncbi:MAG: peptidase S10, partial [Pseudomonadota bacterium]
MKTPILSALSAAALSLSLTASPALADGHMEKKAAPAAKITPQEKTTRHSGTFGGVRMNYSATIKETILEGKDGKQEAVIVTTTYMKDPSDTSRPVFFIYNGGPGSGSVWLQMGAFGPKRVAIPSDAKDDGAPPYPILDNPAS